jgi:hypothetical protein
MESHIGSRPVPTNLNGIELRGSKYRCDFSGFWWVSSGRMVIARRRPRDSREFSRPLTCSDEPYLEREEPLAFALTAQSLEELGLHA